VPVCLIGQGVVWNTARLLKVLEVHSHTFEGDDLENTVLALQMGMRLYWEKDAILLRTIPKPTMLSLLRQRALSWDFGLFRVLLERPTLGLAGDAGAFYKNVLLMDFVAHPLRLFAIPLLLSVLYYRLTGASLLEGAGSMYSHALTWTFRYGSNGIIGIWLLSVLNSLACVGWRIRPTVKWAMFNAAYLASPFVFVMYYRLIAGSAVPADIAGAAGYWLGAGLLLTYLWWVLLTLVLLLGSSLERREKSGLLWSVLLAPLYFGVLFVICRTIGIVKAVVFHLVERRGAVQTSVA